MTTKRIQLAAQMQALAMSMAQANPAEPVTSSALAKHPDAVRLGAQDHHAICALTALARPQCGMLVRVRMGYGRARYGYTLPPDKMRKVEQTQPSKPEAEATVADARVTLVKSTGALRVEVKGIRIEIMVAE